MNFLTTLLTSAVVITLFTSCSSTQNSASMPVRFIKQPYTLPDNVSAWGTAGQYFERTWRGKDESFDYPIPVPLYWEYSFNDSVTLEIPILPMSFRWRLYSGERSEFGVRLGMREIRYDNTSKLSAATLTSFYYKHILSENFALLILPTYYYIFADKIEETNYSTGAISLGLLSQVTEDAAIVPKIGVSFNERTGQSYLLPQIDLIKRINQHWQLEVMYGDYMLQGRYIDRRQLSFVFKKFF